jgi:hypothetical protein
MDPTLAGFIQFVRQIMGIPATILPDTSTYLAEAFWASMTIVNQFLEIVGTAEPPVQQFPTYYGYAVYNLAGDFLVRYTLDDTTLTPPNDTYFQTLRKQMNLNAFVPGIIQSSSDQGTSQSFAIPDFIKSMTLGDLQLMQTPWGRNYLNLAQAYGPSIWGLTP